MVNEEIIAYYSLHPPQNGIIHLENLFILPAYIGKGFGKLLLEAAIQEATSLACKQGSRAAIKNE